MNALCSQTTSSHSFDNLTICVFVAPFMTPFLKPSYLVTSLISKIYYIALPIQPGSAGRNHRIIIILNIKMHYKKMFMNPEF